MHMFKLKHSQVAATEPSDSFVHLHAAVALPPGSHPPARLPVHSYFLSPGLVGDTGWPTLTIATAIDASLAPAGVQVLHMYCAEPFAPWARLARGSEEYAERKAARAEDLWRLAEQVRGGPGRPRVWTLWYFTVCSQVPVLKPAMLPDSSAHTALTPCCTRNTLCLQVVPGARRHTLWETVGTPLTHARFRRRSTGAYGPRPHAAGAAATPAPDGPAAVMPMRGVYCCGDCVFPFIGTPAAAASGAWVANTLAPVSRHLAALNVVD